MCLFRALTLEMEDVEFWVQRSRQPAASDTPTHPWAVSSCQCLPENELSGAALHGEGCLLQLQKQILPSHPHICSLQLASCDWPELFLASKTRRVCLLQPAGRKHCSSKDGNGCSNPSDGYRGVRCGLIRQNDARDPQGSLHLTLEERGANLIPFILYLGVS